MVLTILIFKILIIIIIIIFRTSESIFPNSLNISLSDCLCCLYLYIFSIESYSCKMTGNDKKLYKDMNTYGKSPTDLEALSPSESQMQKLHGVSPNSMFLPSIERLSSIEDNDPSKVSVMKRKMLFTLISTLNASFPDYDFSSVKSEAFSREENLSWVVNNINSNLSTSMGEDYIKLSPGLWKSIDDEICLQDCQIFR